MGGQLYGLIGSAGQKWRNDHGVGCDLDAYRAVAVRSVDHHGDAGTASGVRGQLEAGSASAAMSIKCVAEDCSREAVVLIEVQDGVTAASCPFHAASVIWRLKEMFPTHRGIRTKSLLKWGRDG